MLSHLQLGEVQAERLCLPDEVLYLAIGKAGCAGAVERRLEHHQVG